MSSENEEMGEQNCLLVAEFFSVYANPTRISILCALRSGRKSVSELAEHGGVSLQNISQHLRIMRDKGAVIHEKEGQHVFYSIADEKFLFGIKMIHDALVENMQKKANAYQS